MASEVTLQCTDRPLTEPVIPDVNPQCTDNSLTQAMTSEITPECPENPFIQEEDYNSSEGHELCTAALEIDNALSDEPVLLESQSEFLPLNISENDTGNNTVQGKETEKDQSMIAEETANEVSMADEEAASDQSQLSEGIIINSEGMDKIASFDSEFETPAVVVKSEPIDPDEDTILAADNIAQETIICAENVRDPNLSLTQSALQLQFSVNSGCSAIAHIKQEAIDEGFEKNVPEHNNLAETAPFLGKKKGRKKLSKKLGRASNKHLEMSALGKKFFQRDQNLQVSDIPAINTMDLCLVCSAPCIITRNRKIPSLPFCRKCKKAYFYQLGHSRKRPIRCNSGKSCVIHYRNGIHCPVCHLEKFQRILHVAQAAFRSRSDFEPSCENNKSITKRKKAKESGFVSDDRLIQEALHSYPLVVLNKMPVSPNETVDTKDMPDVFITAEKGASLDKVASPRMFAMPYEEDIVKQEVAFPLIGPGPCGSATADFHPETKDEKPVPKLGPIKIPFFSSQSKVGKSSSCTSLSSLPGPSSYKRGRGRPRKSSSQVQVSPQKSPPQSQVQKSPQANPTSTPMLSSILREPRQEPVLRKLEAGEKDIKIFVFECGHACSACNHINSKKWLRQNGYSMAEPSSQKQHSLQPDSSLYQKFVEFYNAALNSAPPKTTNKTRSSNVQPSKILAPDKIPIPTNMIPNSASGSQPQLIVFPGTPQFMDLTNPPVPVSNSNFVVSSPPSSFRARHAEGITPTSIPSSQGTLPNEVKIQQESLAVKPSTVPNCGPPNLANMNAVRLALNSHLMKQEGRLGYIQPNRFFLPPQSFPLGLPLQAITPSSSVRQPGAPYFLSPSSSRTGSNSKSSPTLKPKKP